MPDLTQDQMADVVFYLGLPGKVINPDSTHFNGVLTDRMKNLLQPTIDRIVELLGLIKETRAKLDATRDDGNISGVGEIQLDPRLTDKYIQKQHSRYLNELAHLLDLPRANMGGVVKF